MRKSISLFLAFLGLFDSLYLLWIYTSPTRTMVCLGTGCDTVRLSAFSHFWGVPMPVFGAAGYALMALLIIAESLVAPELAIEVRYALAGRHRSWIFIFTVPGISARICDSRLLRMVRYLGRGDDPALRTGHLQRRAPGAGSGPARPTRTIAPLFRARRGGAGDRRPRPLRARRGGEAPPPPPPPPPNSAAGMLVRPDSHVAGNPQAALTVVEFGDFECPVCGREASVALEIRNKYAKQIRFVFRQFPLIHTHPFAERMAEASECAADQGKFWEAVEKIYSRQDDLSEDALKRDAAEIGLDPAKFDQCMAGGAEAARVKRDREDGLALGVNATPTFFIGKKVVSGAPDVQEFSQDVDQELAALGTGANPSSPPPEPRQQPWLLRPVQPAITIPHRRLPPRRDRRRPLPNPPRPSEEHWDQLRGTRFQASSQAWRAVRRKPRRSSQH